MSFTFEADSSASMRCLTVTLSPDDLVEGEEAFTADLVLVSDPSLGVSVGNSQATITISDADCELFACGLLAVQYSRVLHNLCNMLV